jgi:pilus assembly protein Flp/PilA
MLSMLKRLWRNESGQDLVEYVLLMALIALVLVAGIHTLGNSIAKSTAASANTLKAVAAGQQSGGGGQQGDGGDQQGNDQQGGGHH